jgi:hypothetical protein
MVGCRVQQTCTACAEKAAEVVRNGKGGTGLGLWQARAEGAPRSRDARLAWWSLGTVARSEQLPASAGTPFGRGRWSTGSGRAQQMSTEGQSLRSPMRGVRQDSPLTSFGKPAPRPRRVGDELLREEASERRAEGMRGVDDDLPGGARRTMTLAVETGCTPKGQQETATGLGLRFEPTVPCAGPTPAGPHVGLAATSVAAGHLPTGCSPGSTVPCRTALEGRPATSGTLVFGPESRGSASPRDFFGGHGGGGADRVLEHGKGQEGSPQLGRQPQPRRPARSVKIHPPWQQDGERSDGPRERPTTRCWKACTTDLASLRRRGAPGAGPWRPPLFDGPNRPREKTPRLLAANAASDSDGPSPKRADSKCRHRQHQGPRALVQSVRPTMD